MKAFLSILLCGCVLTLAAQEPGNPPAPTILSTTRVHAGNHVEVRFTWNSSSEDLICFQVMMRVNGKTVNGWQVKENKMSVSYIRNTGTTTYTWVAKQLRHSPPGATLVIIAVMENATSEESNALPIAANDPNGPPALPGQPIIPPLTP